MGIRLSVLATVLVGLASCVPAQSVGISQSNNSWDTKADDPIMGIDRASISRITLLTGHAGKDVPFVIWSDLSGTSGGGGGSIGKIGYDGAHQGNRRNVRVLVKPTDIPSEIEIDNRSFKFAKGKIFLISTQSTPARVKQLKLDPKKLPRDREKLTAFARSNNEIVGFFSGMEDEEPAE